MLGVAVSPAPLEAQDAEENADDGGDATPPPESALPLARAIEGRLTVWRSPGGRVTYVSHCRFAPSGCRARIAAFARYIADASDDHGIDPFVLAAMAFRESGFDPFATGAAGEVGLVQLHPRGIGRGVRFIQNERYRERCRREVGACQQEVVAVGAAHFADAIANCGGVRDALGYYNRGVCGETDYSRRVLRERDRLIELAKTPTSGGRALVD
jgi:hypothetical protein